MFEFKPRTIKLPCGIGEFDICKKTQFHTPFGILKGEENIENAEALYLFFFDMVNDGGQDNYEEARNLYANPEFYIEWKEK
jgi:hypothetical protein